MPGGKAGERIWTTNVTPGGPFGRFLDDSLEALKLIECAVPPFITLVYLLYRTLPSRFPLSIFFSLSPFPPTIVVGTLFFFELPRLAWDGGRFCLL